MMVKLPSSKITDLVTTVETEIFQTPKGPMVWGAVDICYSSEGLEPRITIKVPVPVLEGQSETQRQTEALRRARKLIDHACIAIEPEAEPQGGKPNESPNNTRTEWKGGSGRVALGSIGARHVTAFRRAGAK